MPFGFYSMIVNNGLDTGASPAWQMVPLRGTRTLTVNGVGPGPVILQPFPRDPTIVRAAQSGSGINRRVTLTGLKEGKTIVDWLPSAPAPGQTAPAVQQLEVSVKTEKQVSTAFFYVNDGHSQVTTRAIADINTLVTNINNILIPQANVKIIKKSAAALSVSQNLGSVVRFSSHLSGVAASEHEWDDLLTHRDSTADMNVFFVKEYEQDATPGVDNVDGGTIAADKTILYEDNISHPDADALAHEFVHGLGRSGHSGSNTHLMGTGAAGIGRFIPKADANIINTSGS